MKTAHKIRMNPTPEQVEYLKRACGTRRFIYNWGREQWEKQYQAYQVEQTSVPGVERKLKAPNAFALKKQFNEIREREYPWTYEVTKCVVEGAFDDLKSAYDNFFAGRADYPTYKKKGKSHESFYLSNDKFTVGSQWISIPGLGRFILDQRQTKKGRGKLLRKLGTVNLAEKLRFVEEGKATAPTKKRNKRKQVLCESVKLLGATVSCEAGHWYVSIQVEIKQQRPATPSLVVGVDVGLKQAAVVSDGRRLENQRPLASHLKKLGKLQRKLSKKQKTKVANAEGDLFIASRWFPSTKRCSCCGHVKKRMPLKHRTYQCLVCGLVIDRDLNAALNLWWFATQQLRQLHAESWPSWAVATTDDVKAPVEPM